MLGDGAVRHCSRCEKKVFDLSLMTLGQAEALIASEGGRCVRLRQRADGTMMFADCIVGARGVQKRQLRAAGAALAIRGAFLAWATQPVEAARPPLAPQASSASARRAGDAFLVAPPHVEPADDWQYAVGGLMDPVVLEVRPRVTTTLVGGHDVFEPDVTSWFQGRQRSMLRACYERELHADPALDAGITIRLTIAGASGRVSDVHTRESTVGPEAEACVLATARRMRLRPGAATTSYDVAIDFRRMFL